MSPVDPSLYSGLRHAHLTAVGLSLGLFAIRAGARLLGANWVMRPSLRYLSYAIDTVLLACGAGLWWLLGLNLLQQPWLLVKLLWLLAYIIMGSLALKRAPTRGMQVVSLAAAVFCAYAMVATAITHHPQGAWRMLGLLP